MRKLMTRAEAVAATSEETVAAAEAKNCEPTNVCGLNGRRQGDDWTEWSATHDEVTAYYYTSNEQDDMAEEAEDLSVIDWEIAGYEVN